MGNKISSLLIAAAIFLLCVQAVAQVELDEKMLQMNGEKDRYFKAGMQEYGISGGYGFADEREYIQSIFLLPKWGLFLADFDKVKGALEFEVEPVLGMYISPSRAIAAGVNVLFTYNFETGTRIIPFFSAGAGFLYTNLKVSELGSKFNGSPQGGPGIKYMVNDHTAISLQTRIHHISNAGTAKPNRGVDSFLFLIGVDFYR
jgi:hypothetical protein